ncbi:MAG TPA: glutathione S-transferase family protein [Sphingobium sp.]|nr:glutathione S-transferase family protein [Sphingobium sp.]
MADLVFYTHPMSRGQIVRWMLEELGVSYDQHILDFDTTMKEPEYLAVNPMGKVPAIVHRGKTVTEAAAICTYLADAFPDAGLAPPLGDRADYYRWIFYASGPMEAAFSNKAAGWEPTPERQRMFGYGNYQRAVDTLAGAVDGRRFIAGDRFSAADVYVGSQIDFMLQFGLIETRSAFEEYVAPLRERPAYKRAKEIDAALGAELQSPAGS